jgi:MSHA biogenesis protein MshJ
MNPRLKQQARRINALSLRERAMMFASLAAALVAAADALVLSPRLAEQKALGAQLRQHTQELEALRAQFSGVGATETPQQALLRQLQQTRAEQQAADQAITQRLAELGAGARLPELLERVLRRHDRLTLVRLATVPPAPGAKAAAVPTQAVEIALRGAYADLTQYVADAERELPGLRWGELSVASVQAGTELTARVLLPGVAP